ncbi:MAG: hypothetical protein JSU63_10825 [Phycisphaerales bacterium]|nr:MAG: hypothetical protein JSU63_10825 [Phycisphaerales bacterium]
MLMIDSTMSEIRDPIEHRLSRAAERVRTAIGELVDTMPVRVKRPAEFQRVLKLDRSLSSRVLRALQMDDPLAALQRMPGPHGLRLLLKAAKKVTSDEESVLRAEEALDDLEHLVTSEIGDWKALEAALCGWLPDAREQFEMSNRQVAFRAMSNIKGVMAHAELSVTLIHPGAANTDCVDRAGITGICRMRRLRPGTPMGLLHGSSIAPPPGTQRLSLEGNRIDPTHGAPLLREFSSSPTPKFEVRVDGEIVHYVLTGDGVGVSSAVDLYFADVMRGRYPSNKSISPRPATPGAVIDIPVKTLIVDVLVHEEVWPGVEPELRMYDTAGRGIANPTDPSRDMDRVDVLESIQSLGTQFSRFRTTEVARYPDMVRFVCGRLGWDSERFRGFRCRVDYPVYGTQVSMIFEPPALTDGG